MTKFHTCGSLKFKSKSISNNSSTTKESSESKTKVQIAFDQHKQFRSINNPKFSNPIQKPSKKKSHKERVDEFNSYLEKLPEHNDIPRIGPG